MEVQACLLKEGLMKQLKLALVQMAGAAVRDFRQTAGRIDEQIQAACRTGADLVLLPECAYPAYMLGGDEAAMAEAIAATGELVQRVAGLARENRVYIVLGLALPRDGHLYNAALVFDCEGREIGFGAKSNLWHFDGKWFAAGPPAAVFDTAFGRMGVMVCADGRLPELAELLRLQGAELILDPVNLVASAPTPAQFANLQHSFMLAARARENGVFIAVSNKCGVEADVVTYLGRSFVVDPLGRIVAEASPDREEILTCTVDLAECRPLPPRRPSLFEPIARPTAELPIQQYLTANRALAGSIAAAGTPAGCTPSWRQSLTDLTLYTLVARFPADSAEAYADEAVRFIQAAGILSARLVVLPELRRPQALGPAVIERIQAALGPDQLAILAGSEPAGQADGPLAAAGAAGPAADTAARPAWRRRALVLSQAGCIGAMSATHDPDSLPGDTIEVVALTPDIRAAALFDAEIEIPEIARTAMLQGADLLVCFDSRRSDWTMRLLQTRAAENRMFVIRSSSVGGADSSVIVSPDAAVITTTLATPVHSAAGLVNTALSKLKDVVPGTNVVADRQPEWYWPLTE